ncbi:MFS transporter [Bacillus sp. FJAT-29814]|uniref:MFS transporter n=1 Tax=Bacillus sp. FJAT-29814 TaxID=1729688 RepID=UPI0008299A83|nr:MFS transporter [Bacillus sp. FJAT-29814]
MTDSVSSNKRLWTKDFILTSLSNFFIFFSFHMLTPTLPIFVVERGGDKLEAGLVVGMFTVTALIIRPFAGHALDRIDQKKVLLFGLIVFTAALISFNWLFSITLILVIRIVQGVGWGISSTTYAAMITDQIAAERRAEGVGYFGLSINLAMASAPLLGIWLMINYGFPYVFLIASLSVMISMALSKVIHFPKNLNKKSNLEKTTFIEKSSLLPALLIMLVTLSHGGILSSLTLFGKETGLENVGWFFMATAIMMMITRSITGRIADQKGRVYVLIPGAIAFGIGLILLSFSANVAILVAAALFYGIGFGSIQPTLQAWTISRALPHRRGMATATYFSAFDIGVGVGALLVGLLAKWIEYAAIYKLLLFFVIVYFLSYCTFLNRQKKNVAIPIKHRESIQRE